jgi:uncharacterized protein (TIGR02246 family)
MHHSASRLLLAGLASLGPPLAEAAGPESPQALIEAWVRASNAHDMKVLASLYAEDADFVNAEGMLFQGREQIMADHERSHAAHFRNATFTMKIKTLRLPRPDLAVIRHEGEVTGLLDSASNPRPPRHGLALVVAAKTGDGWRIIAKQSTDAPKLN